MKRPGQRGFTLIQLMITVAVMGIFGALVSRMFMRGLQEWFQGKAGMLMQQTARIAKDRLAEDLRHASLSSVVISRHASNQALMSQISFVDANGNSLEFYQSGDKLVWGNWGVSPTAMISQNNLIQSNVSRFLIYYPNVKAPQLIAFRITMLVLPYRDAPKAIQLSVDDQVELKNP
jgi:prepilin-type N-terminal cleavage/methylation domain-containing protein